MAPALRIDVLTLFPEMFAGTFEHGILGRARDAGLLHLAVHHIRDWTHDRHRTVDDYAYGGGSGMVMKPEPLARAIEATRGDDGWVVLLTPQGKLLNHEAVVRLERKEHLVLVCGRYEGVDERVRALLVDEEISIGDYVLAGGELPAMVLAEAVARLVPGVVGKEDSVASDSHVCGLLEHPHYTRPRTYRGLETPDVLLSGHHAQIDEWRRRESLRRTLLRRPDLLGRARISEEELDWLRQEEPEAMQRFESASRGPAPGGRLEKAAES